MIRQGSQSAITPACGIPEVNLIVCAFQMVQGQGLIQFATKSQQTGSLTGASSSSSEACQVRQDSARHLLKATKFLRSPHKESAEGRTLRRR